MALRFQRRIKIAPGVRLNLSKSGFGMSLGPRGGAVSIGPRGVHSHLGLPGTGLGYRTQISTFGAQNASSRRAQTSSNSEIIMLVGQNGQVRFETETGAEAPPAMVRKFRASYAELIQATLENSVAALNETLDALLSIHMGTPGPQFAPLGLDADPRPMPTKADPIPLRFLDRLFGRRRAIEEKNALAETEFHESLMEWNRETAQRNAEIDNLRRLNDGVSAGDIDASAQSMDIRLANLTWAKETIVSFDFGEEASTLTIDIDLPEADQLPRTHALFPTRGLNITMSNRTAQQLKRDFVYVAHATLFRVAGEAFSALPKLRETTLSGYTQRIDPAIGRLKDAYVISCRIDRAEWEKIDFGRLCDVDPVEALGRFQLVRDLTRGGELKEIQPL